MNINTELHRTIGADAFERGEAFNENESYAWKQGWLNAQAASTSENNLSGAGGAA